MDVATTRIGFANPDGCGAETARSSVSLSTSKSRSLASRFALFAVYGALVDGPFFVNCTFCTFAGRQLFRFSLAARRPLFECWTFVRVRNRRIDVRRFGGCVFAGAAHEPNVLPRPTSKSASLCSCCECRLGFTRLFPSTSAGPHQFHF